MTRFLIDAITESCNFIVFVPFSGEGGTIYSNGFFFVQSILADL